MEEITRVDGNGRTYVSNLPKIVILGYINEVALQHIQENTDLVFVKQDDLNDVYEAQPLTSNQITTLFMTYDFKTRYYDNYNIRNAIYLKLDYNVGFDVESICFDCCKHNRINTMQLQKTDRMSC